MLLNINPLVTEKQNFITNFRVAKLLSSLFDNAVKILYCHAWARAPWCRSLKTSAEYRQNCSFCQPKTGLHFLFPFIRRTIDKVQNRYYTALEFHQPNYHSWIFFLMSLYTLRHLKKVEKKYSVFKNSIFRLFNFFQYFIKSQNRHFLTPFLGAKKLLYVLYE